MYFSRSVYLSESANEGLNELIKLKHSNASRIINELIIREAGIARKRLARQAQKVESVEAKEKDHEKE